MATNGYPKDAASPTDADTGASIRPEAAQFETRRVGDLMKLTKKPRLELVSSDSGTSRITRRASFRQADHEGTTAATGSILVAPLQAEPQSTQEQDVDASDRRSIAEVAHDFNNLFSIIIGNAELLSYKVHGENRTLAEFILEAAERGTDLTRRLRAFAVKPL
jgi:signal transduction histidine kinase